MASAFTLKEYEVLGRLPDPFLRDDGTRISTPDEWAVRRREMYRTVIEMQYGTQPPAPEFLEVKPLYTSAKISSYRITSGTRANPVSFTMKVFGPEKAERDLPVVIDGDLCFAYAFDRDYLAAVTSKDMLFVLFDRTEIVPDVKEDGRNAALYRAYPDLTFGALGAWAWGYSRCVDALEMLGIGDLRTIAFSGHSRGGKTALLAGILDERAAIVNPNDTCAGAGSCYRIHMKATLPDGKELRSETLKDLMDVFGYWMGPKMQDYTACEETLPFDAHFTKAMIAPRVLLLSEAAGDIWSNPIGAWQTSLAAGEVYRFLGAEENLLWYFRDGGHYHKVEDVEMLANAIEHYRKGTPLHKDFYRRPFDAQEPIFDWHAPKAE